MISSESSTINGLRRRRTPSAPVPNRNAATPRYQATLGPSIDLLPARMRTEDDAADRRDEQHDRRDLEGEQVVGEEQAADLARRSEAPRDVRRMVEPPAGLQPDRDDHLDEDRGRGPDRAHGLPGRPARPGRLELVADVRD